LYRRSLVFIFNRLFVRYKLWINLKSNRCPLSIGHREKARTVLIPSNRYSLLNTSSFFTFIASLNSRNNSLYSSWGNVRYTILSFIRLIALGMVSPRSQAESITVFFNPISCATCDCLYRSILRCNCNLFGIGRFPCSIDNRITRERIWYKGGKFKFKAKYGDNSMATLSQVDKKIAITYTALRCLEGISLSRH